MCGKKLRILSNCGSLPCYHALSEYDFLEIDDSFFEKNPRDEVAAGLHDVCLVDFWGIDD